MITITIWSDFACPYCYIGEKRLQNAIHELGLENDVQIDFRAYELDPTAPKEVTTNTPERFAAKYRLSEKDALAQIEKISELGRNEGIDFRYATTRYSNTRDAHRLMKLAEAKYDRATVGRLNEALFKAYFTENLVLADHAVLLDKGVGAGMSADDIKAVLESDMYADEVRLDEREATLRGVRGVPYMVFSGGLTVPGAMSTDGYRSALEREMQKLASTKDKITERSYTCGPDSCKLV